jgi:site-specific DNA-methyltransferase (adenine-specific)
MNAPHIPDAIALCAVTDLIPYANNARTHSDDQVAKIAASIQEFGFTNPILVADGVIVAGHGRLAAARKLGLARVPTIDLSHLSPAQRKAYVLADNRLALDAGWDNDLLKVELEGLQDAGFDIDLIGFSTDELIDLMTEKTVGNTDEDDAPEVDQQSPAVSSPGDVWVLGPHRVMCGDSTSLDAVAALMGGALADILITDPPYNVAYEGKTKDALTIKNDSMSDDAFRTFLRDAFVAADSVMKAGAVFYVWHADIEGYNFRGACRDTGWTVRQCLVWAKSTMVMGRQDYHCKHEPCLYGWKEGAAHLWAADRKQTTLLNFDKPARNGEHPTMKPVALFEYQLLNNTKGQDVVLDLFGGSGTTVIAAEKNGRVARVMELDPRYCDVIVKRWQEFSGKVAQRESDGMTFDAARGVPSNPEGGA